MSEGWVMMREVFGWHNIYSIQRHTPAVPVCVCIIPGREHSTALTFVVDDHILWSYTTLASAEKFESFLFFINIFSEMYTNVKLHLYYPTLYYLTLLTGSIFLILVILPLKSWGQPWAWTYRPAPGLVFSLMIGTAGLCFPLIPFIFSVAFESQIKYVAGRANVCTIIALLLSFRNLLIK